MNSPKPVRRSSVVSMGSPKPAPVTGQRSVSSIKSSRSVSSRALVGSSSNSSNGSSSNGSSSKTSSSNVQVYVRVRPFTPKEIKNQEVNIVRMVDGKETRLIHPETKHVHKFTFDKSYWSFSKDSEDFVSQEDVFRDIGYTILENAWKGYNASLFAYGQTGSGKTYSTFGSSGDLGVIPRVCNELFKMIETRKEEGTTYTVEASMLEIYSEKVRDLLNPTNKQNETGLRVRENKQTGPYVEGLSINYCANAKELLELLDQGQKYKTIASTSMNDTSSRAHTIFQLYFTQTRKLGKKVAQTRSIISLIDLAGSERVSKAQTSGIRLQEGAAINLSLSMLGTVINKLSEGKDEFIPYRNSTLTFLLRESLGGNSKTIMLSTISPAASNYEESLSTLQYAHRAKNIKNKARINEDSTSKIIKELRAQIEELQRQLLLQSEHSEENERLRQQLLESQMLIQQFGMTDQERASLAKMQKEKRTAFFEKAGIIIEDRKTIPHFVNLNEDVSLNECLLYFFKPNTTTKIGSDPDKCDIQLNDPKVLPDHCTIENVDNKHVYVIPNPNGVVYVNGERVVEKKELFSSDRVIIGAHQVFRFTNPSIPSNDNRIIDIEFAREEIHKRLEQELAEQQSKKLLELDAIYNKKQSEHEMKILELENQRKKLLEEIEQTQKLQLQVVTKSHYDTEELRKLEDDVSFFRKKLKEEQERKSQMELESQKSQSELLELRETLQVLTSTLAEEQQERARLQEIHAREIEAMREEQRKIKDQSAQIHSTLNLIKSEKEELERDLMRHKAARENSEKRLYENLTEQASLLPVLQSILNDQEMTMKKRIDELSMDLAQKVSEIEHLQHELRKMQQDQTFQRDEFLSRVLYQNEELERKIQELQSKESESTGKLHAENLNLQREISMYRAQIVEFERIITELNLKLTQKEAIIRALQGEYD